MLRDSSGNVAASTPDSPTLESIFSSNYAALRRYAQRIVNDREEAAEIAQETFLRLQQILEAGNSAPAETVFLYRVARNLAIDSVRRRLTRRRFETTDGRIMSSAAEKSTEDELLEQEERTRIRQALRVLRPRDAECLALRNRGCSYGEVAQILHIHPASVGPTVSRALRRLRQAYFGLTTGTAQSADRSEAR
jgi:RNA polymerase sigma factor (sigma-70 family)